MKQDKRRHPRVAHKIRVRSHERDAVELETIDLSVGGFSCTAPVFLAPMTKLAVSLVLPHDNGGRDVEQTVKGEAVVVRTEPAYPSAGHKGGYRVALFFSQMEEDDRHRLNHFLGAKSEQAGH